MVRWHRSKWYVADSSQFFFRIYLIVFELELFIVAFVTTGSNMHIEMGFRFWYGPPVVLYISEGFHKSILCVELASVYTKERVHYRKVTFGLQKQLPSQYSNCCQLFPVHWLVLIL